MWDHSFCHACGARYSQTTSWPRECEPCGRIQYLNTIPVGVLLVPVWNAISHDLVEPGTQRGIIVGRRGHEPGLGLWGLPGGFGEFAETAEQCAERELWEETGLKVDANYIKPSHTRNNSTGSQLLIFNDYQSTLTLTDLKEFVPCKECPEIKVCWEPEELAFKTHTEALELWFKKEWG